MVPSRILSPFHLLFLSCFPSQMCTQKKWINENRLHFSSSFSFLFSCQQQNKLLAGKPLSMSATEFKEKNSLLDSFWNCSLFLSSAQKLKLKQTPKAGVYFQGKTPFIAFAFSTFSLKLRIWNHQNATIATVCRLALEIVSNIWSRCADVCSSNIYLRHFSNTWEKNREWNHNRGTCHLLWTAEFDLFWREQANKSVLWSVSRRAFFTSAHAILLLSMQGCSFHMQGSLVAAILHPFFIYLVWFRMQQGHTHTHRRNHS